MKNTKRLLTWILVAVLVVSAIALVACVEKPEPTQLTELTLPQLKDNQMAVIIKNGNDDYTSYVVTLGDRGIQATTAEDVLNYLQQQVDLFVDWQDGVFGKFLNAVGSITPDANKGEYVAVLTSNPDFYGSWAGVDRYIVGDVTLVSSEVGVTDLQVTAGDVIYFELATY